MSVSAFFTGLSAFFATNLDDIVILLLFFSQVGPLLRRRHIVWGQYLGFGVLVLASLPGFFGSLLLPSSWVGLLGIVPIVLGLNRLFGRSEESDVEAPVSQSAWGGVLSPQTYGVAALTVANGSDNIGVYLPLFAHCTWETLGLILSVFFVLVGVWCYAAYQLARLPVVADVLMRYGNYCIPYVLIGLGAMILWDSQALADRGLTVIALSICLGYLLVLNWTIPLSEIEEN